MELPVGTRLKSWVLGRPIGRGAFGFVYEAKTAGDSATYALKVALRVGKGASKLKKSTQSKEAALLFKEYTLYTGALARGSVATAERPETAHDGGSAPHEPF